MTSSTFPPLSFIVSTYKLTHPSSAINATATATATATTTTTTTSTTTTMDPQLLLPSPATEFNFNSTSTSPYTTAPSSPKLLFPKSFYNTPTITHQHQTNDNLEEPEPEPDHMDFAFDFSGQLEPPSISDADELFDGGKIKPLEPPPPPPPPLPPPLTPPQSPNEALIPSTLAPVSYHNINSKTFSEALRRTPKDQPQTQSSASSTSQFGFTWYNKWNLKNLLLFRSTSEGSATTIGDQSKKYSAITKGDDGDMRNLSFRSCDGDGSSRRRRRMKRKMSAHEMHYTANRAVAEEMRRRTSLPYKSGLLGCLGFSRNLHDVSSRGRR